MIIFYRLILDCSFIFMGLTLVWGFIKWSSSFWFYTFKFLMILFLSWFSKSWFSRRIDLRSETLLYTDFIKCSLELNSCSFSYYLINKLLKSKFICLIKFKENYLAFLIKVWIFYIIKEYFIKKMKNKQLNDSFA